MTESFLLHDLISKTASAKPEAAALTYGKADLSYGELDAAVNRFASGLISLGLERGERVAIYLEKRFETVIASFGTPAAGGVFVPRGAGAGCVAGSLIVLLGACAQARGTR